MKATPSWWVFEEFVARQLGLTQTVASGSKFNDPGDAVTSDPNHPFPLYADAKYTERASFSISRKMVEKYLAKATELGKRLIIPVRVWPRGQLRPTDVVMMPFHDFVELYEYASRYKDLEHADGRS